MLHKIKQKYAGILFLAFIALSLFSCEDDFQEIGGSLVDNIDFSTNQVLVEVNAYTRSFINGDGVQTNIPGDVGSLGVYDDALYGRTVASTLSQLRPLTQNPKFGTKPKVDSVVLNIPYFSTVTGTTNQRNQYRLDSVFGGGSVRLTGYRSNYFLSDDDPIDVSKSAKYYSNSLNGFQGLEGDLLFPTDTILPLKRETIIKPKPQTVDSDQDTVTVRSKPALRLNLNASYWDQIIIKMEGKDALFNDNSFKNYFRGIYLKTEPLAAGAPTYFLFNVAEAQVIVYYSFETTNDKTKRSRSTYVLSLAPLNTINVTGLTNTFKQATLDEIVNNTATTGANNLFLKGGQGSMAVLDLFGPDNNNDGVPDKLTEFRNKNWLIREANIVVQVDQDKIAQLGSAGLIEPERLYLYNLDTNLPLSDYGADANSVAGHLGQLVRDADGKGVSYKFRITNYVRNLFNGVDNTPATRLGLSVSLNVLNTATGDIDNIPDDAEPSRIPTSAIISQQGTVLYGSTAADATKRVRLEIFYTEVN